MRTQVATVQKFRKGLPEGATLLVCKNNLMKVAIKETPGWENLAEKGCTVRTERCRPSAARQGDVLADTLCMHTCLQGENAWVFVKEDCIADTVKFYFKFEEDLFTEAKKVAAKNQEVKKPTEVSVAAMGTSYLSPAEVRWVSWMQGQRGQLWRVLAGADSTARCHSALLGLMVLLLRISVHAVEEVRVSANKEAAVRHHRWPCQAASNQDCHRHQDGAHQAGHCATEGVRAGRGQVQDRWLARQGVSTKHLPVNMAWYFCTLRLLACWLHAHPGQFRGAAQFAGADAGLLSSHISLQCWSWCT